MNGLPVTVSHPLFLRQRRCEDIRRDQGMLTLKFPVIPWLSTKTTTSVLVTATAGVQALRVQGHCGFFPVVLYSRVALCLLRAIVVRSSSIVAVRTVSLADTRRMTASSFVVLNAKT